MFRAGADLRQQQQAGERLAVAAVVHPQRRDGAPGPVDADHLAAAEDAVLAGRACARTPPC